MYRAASAALVGFGLSVASASAFEVTGGSVGLEYSQYTANAAKDFTKTTLNGSIELGFTREFSVQADLSISDFGVVSGTGTNFGLHGIYHLSETTSLGAFVGREDVSLASFGLGSADWTYLGAEVGHQAGQLETEVYVSVLTESGFDATNLGLRGRYEVNNAVGLGARYDTLRLSGQSVSRLGLTGDLSLGQSAKLYGEVGSARASGAGSEGYVGVGARFNFGAKRGATFEQRGAIALEPGF